MCVLCGIYIYVRGTFWHFVVVVWVDGDAQVYRPLALSTIIRVELEGACFGLDSFLS